MRESVREPSRLADTRPESRRQKQRHQHSQLSSAKSKGEQMEAYRTYNAYISTRLRNLSYLETEKMQNEANCTILYTGFIFDNKCFKTGSGRKVLYLVLDKCCYTHCKKTGTKTAVGSVANPLLQFVQSYSCIYSNYFAEGSSRDLEKSSEVWMNTECRDKWIKTSGFILLFKCKTDMSQNRRQKHFDFNTQPCSIKKCSLLWECTV